MYGISEIKLQNQQDSLTNLYFYLCKNILSVAGRNGEGIIRSSVRKLGIHFGEIDRTKLMEHGRKPNLKSMVEGIDRFTDPRFRFCLLRVTQQEIWLEVHTCPIADLMKRKNAADIGLMFCEEYCHAYFKGFSNGKAQSNLSKTLMCEYDNHCRLSVYYRPANLEAEQREKVFDPEKDLKPACLPGHEYKADESLMHRYFCLYQCLYEGAKALAGNEGRCAVAMGLREYAAAEAGDLKKQADATKSQLDEAFIRINFPVPVRRRENGLFHPVLDNEANDLFAVNFYRPFLKYIGGLGE